MFCPYVQTGSFPREVAHVAHVARDVAREESEEETDAAHTIMKTIGAVHQRDMFGLPSLAAHSYKPRCESPPAKPERRTAAVAKRRASTGARENSKRCQQSAVSAPIRPVARGSTVYTVQPSHVSAMPHMDQE
jgi:hypothetical protein